MKIKIKGNTVRLRLSKTEVAQVVEQKVISDRVGFPDGALIYTLSQGKGDEVKASFRNNEIRVEAPALGIETWGTTEQVGFSAQLPLPDGQELSVLVEKDFQYNIERKEEDESDLYDNPMTNKVKNE